jgi:hypothetical protein
MIVSEVFSVQLVEKITLVFCSTYQLDVQEKVASLLLEITHQSMSYPLFTYKYLLIVVVQINYVQF